MRTVSRAPFRRATETVSDAGRTAVARRPAPAAARVEERVHTGEDACAGAGVHDGAGARGVVATACVVCGCVVCGCGCGCGCALAEAAGAGRGADGFVSARFVSGRGGEVEVVVLGRAGRAGSGAVGAAAAGPVVTAAAAGATAPVTVATAPPAACATVDTGAGGDGSGVGFGFGSGTGAAAVVTGSVTGSCGSVTGPFAADVAAGRVGNPPAPAGATAIAAQTPPRLRATKPAARASVCAV
jgi:hypothetical protein